MRARIIRYISSSFPAQAVILFTLLAALNYLPVFAGRVPLPLDVVINFPLWESIRGPEAIRLAHAELGDLVTIIYPWRDFAGKAIKDGIVPLWNPHVLLGTPFLADGQSSVFYPLNVVYYIFPTYIGWSLSLLIRIILAGVFASLFARLLGMSRIGSLSTGIIFTFSGFMIAWQGWPLADSGLWLPAVCLGVERLRQRPDISTAALTGAAFAIPVLAGHPEIALFVILTGTAYAIYRLFPSYSESEKSRKQRGLFMLLFTASGILAIAIAAVQILPTAEWLGHTHRSLEMTGWGGRPLAEAAGFLSRDARSNPNSVGVAIPEGATYSGIMTLLAASLAPLYRRKAHVLFFLSLLAFALQVIYGMGPAFWAVDNAPVLRALPNWRMILMANFSLAVLAGFGISAFEEMLRTRPGKRVQSLWLALLCLAAAGSAYGISELYSRTGAANRPVEWLYHPQSSLILLVLSAVILSPLALRLRPSKIFIGLVPLVIILDMLSFSYGHIPFFRKEQVYPEPVIYRKLKEKDSSLYRVASVDKTGPANVEIMYGMFSPTGYDFPLSTTANVLSPYVYSIADTAFSSEKVVKLKSRLLDLMNVKYLVATTYNNSATALSSQPGRYRLVSGDLTIQVFENLSCLPRAFLVPASGIQIIPNESALMDRLASPAFDPEKTVLLTEMPGGFDAGKELPGATPELTVSSIRQGVNDVRVSTHTNSPAVLVLSDIHYPGWKVFVNGREEELLRVDYAFKGVALPAGSHEVEFVFKPDSFRTGFIISLIATVVLLAALIMQSKLKKNVG